MFRKSQMYSTDALFTGLELLKLDDIVKIEQCKLGYRLENKELLTPIQKISEARGGKKTHRYNTRNKNMPNIQKHNTTTFNNSYLCRSINSYSELPAKLKRRKNIKSFSKALRTHLINQYLGSMRN